MAIDDRRYGQGEHPVAAAIGRHSTLRITPPEHFCRSFRSYEVEIGRAGMYIVVGEVVIMLSPVWLMLSALLYSLQLNTGSFPKPLTEAEERDYLEKAKNGDLEARNVLIEKNLRLVAHIMKKG